MKDFSMHVHLCTTEGYNIACHYYICLAVLHAKKRTRAGPNGCMCESLEGGRGKDAEGDGAKVSGVWKANRGRSQNSSKQVLPVRNPAGGPQFAQGRRPTER